MRLQELIDKLEQYKLDLGNVQVNMEIDGTYEGYKYSFDIDFRESKDIYHKNNILVLSGND